MSMATLEHLDGDVLSALVCGGQSCTVQDVLGDVFEHAKCQGSRGCRSPGRAEATVDGRTAVDCSRLADDANHSYRQNIANLSPTYRYDTIRPVESRGSLKDGPVNHAGGKGQAGHQVNYKEAKEPHGDKSWLRLLHSSTHRQDITNTSHQ